MFERYTEKARQVIFHARYYASQAGSPYIETNHLVLGLLRADDDLHPIIGEVETLREEMQTGPTQSHVSTSVNLPLSHSCKKVLAYGTEESEHARHRSIDTIHILAGLLRTASDDPVHAALVRRGLNLEQVRAQLLQMPAPDHRPDDEARSHRDPLGAIPASRRAAAGEIFLAIASEEEIEVVVKTRGGEHVYTFPRSD
jgi:ATP-dependent Clp protease ATP-binding subunit ClpA